MSPRIVTNSGRRFAVDDAEGVPLAESVVELTGYWCPVCRMPRTPVPGDRGVHADCSTAATASAAGPNTAASNTLPAGNVRGRVA